MEQEKHIVNYSEYCKTCKYFELDGTAEPCNECLSHPLNYYTTKPTEYVENVGE